MATNSEKVEKKSQDKAINLFFLIFGMIAFLTLGAASYKKIESTKTTHYLNKAIKLSEKGNFLESNLYYSKTLEKIKDKRRKAWMYSEMGDNYLFLKDYAKALQAYEKSFNLYPLDAQNCANLGLTLGIMGRYDNAIEYLTIAQELNPKIPQIYNNLGVQFTQQEKIPEAIANFKKAVEVDPKFYRAYTNLSAIYFKLGDYANTKTYIDLALKEGAGNDPYFKKLLQQQLAGLNKELGKIPSQ